MIAKFIKSFAKCLGVFALVIMVDVIITVTSITLSYFVLTKLGCQAEIADIAAIVFTMIVRLAAAAAAINASL